MDTLSFVSSVIEALAWPATLIAALILTRRELRSLLPFLKRLKAGPVEAEFEREVKELQAAPPPSLPPPGPKLVTGRASELLGLADISPRAAITEAWRGVEVAAHKLVLKDADESRPHIIFPLQLVRRLEALGAITKEERMLFHDLRALRNEAAHATDFNPSAESVIGYVQLASALEQRLTNLAGVES